MTALRYPVIVGVGQISSASGGQEPGPGVVDLMQAALQAAEHDAGGTWIGQLDFLGIENQISSARAPWPSVEAITPYVLQRLGIEPRSTLLTAEPSGDGPVFLLNHAANLIASGEAEIAAIVGAEALRTASGRAASQSGSKANAMRDLLDQAVDPFLKHYGLITPTDVYPLYECATRAAWGQSFAEAQQETAILWSEFSRTAATNPDAWIRKEHTPAEIATVSAQNRMITFPYTKLMVANSAVNQGAAVIVTSYEKALEMGVPEDRLIFIGAGAAAHEDQDFLARDRYDGSAAMQVSIKQALELNELGADDLDCVELYSCFPCVVKMARRVLSWPLDRSPSVYGGLTFGGGPIGNCMMHAAVMMTRRLRQGARNGLIFANGGFATHNHSIVLTAQKPVANRFPQNFDYQAVADRQRGPVPPLLRDYCGEGRIEAYTVPYGRDGEPAFGAIVGRTPDGARFVSRVSPEDRETLAFLVAGEREPVGTSGQSEPSDDGFRRWRRM